jgi:hypothetical protein
MAFCILLTVADMKGIGSTTSGKVMAFSTIKMVLS